MTTTRTYQISEMPGGSVPSFLPVLWEHPSFLQQEGGSIVFHKVLTHPYSIFESSPILKLLGVETEAELSRTVATYSAPSWSC